MGTNKPNYILEDSGDLSHRSSADSINNSEIMNNKEKTYKA